VCAQVIASRPIPKSSSRSSRSSGVASLPIVAFTPISYAVTALTSRSPAALSVSRTATLTGWPSSILPSI